MIGQFIPLAMIGQGEEVTVMDIRAGRGLTKRLADMGLTPGATLRIITNHVPGPILVDLRGSRLVLGHSITQKVMVKIEKND